MLICLPLIYFFKKKKRILKILVIVVVVTFNKLCTFREILISFNLISAVSAEVGGISQNSFGCRWEIL